MDLQERDHLHIWHPFTHLKKDKFPIPLVKAEGACFFDDKGKRYIDGIASWWVNIHGHSHPYLTKKITEQLQTLEHAIFSGFTHEPAILLAERMLKRLPSNQKKVFFSDNGSTSVEVALKMAFQFWSNQDSPRTKVIAFENAYHGDTFGGMSVGARNAFNLPFSKLLFDVIHIPVPVKGKEKESAAAMKNALDQETACFIFEPLVQGAAGMIMYEAEPLDELISMCREKKVISIADEVMTGFGRSGTFFASDQLKHKPEIICLSKGLTGGVMPLGLTSCAQFIYDAFLSDDKMKTFFHGHSYTGNPAACSAALASLDLFDKPESAGNIKRITGKHRIFLEKIKGNTVLKDARQKGIILALEIRTKEETGYLNSLSEQISSFFIEKGIILRPLGNVIYILPPYCIGDADLDYIYNSIEEFIEKVYHEGTKNS